MFTNPPSDTEPLAAGSTVEVCVRSVDVLPGSVLSSVIVSEGTLDTKLTASQERSVQEPCMVSATNKA